MRASAIAPMAALGVALGCLGANGAPPEPAPDAELLLNLDMLKETDLARDRDLYRKMGVLERLRMLEALRFFESAPPPETVPVTPAQKGGSAR